jgi:hypothetical protein
MGEAGSMKSTDAAITMDTVFGDAGQNFAGDLFGKLLSAGRRRATGESMFTAAYTNGGAVEPRVAFAAPHAGKISPMDLAKLGGTLICVGTLWRQRLPFSRLASPVIASGLQRGGSRIDGSLLPAVARAGLLGGVLGGGDE